MSDDTSSLEELVEHELIDDVLRRRSLAEIATAWCEYHRSTPPNEHYWWAVELFLTKRWWGDRTRVRQGLTALIRAAAGDNQLLGMIGAGPMEMFLSTNESDLAWIEHEARAWPDFGQALSNVDLLDAPLEVSERIKRVLR